MSYIFASNPGIDLDLAQPKGIDGTWRSKSIRGRIFPSSCRVPQDAIVGETLDGTIASWNAGAAMLFGYAAVEAIGRPTTIIEAHPRSAAVFAALVERVGRREWSPPFDEEYKRRDGTVIRASVVLSAVSDRAGQLVGLSRIIRVLDRPAASLGCAQAADRELAGQLRHLSRWRALGQMAAALAIEANQPLTAIANYLTPISRLLRADQVVEPSVLAFAIDRAIAQAHRAASIVHHVRAFASQDDGAAQAVSLAATVMEASELVLISARQNGVAVTFDLDADGVVHINPPEIRQVIFNLMRNAVEAMADAMPRNLRVTTTRGENGITVSIADTGPGVPLEIAARLFQPFVTDKPDGMGTGLAICHANRHDARRRIVARSRRDERRHIPRQAADRAG